MNGLEKRANCVELKAELRDGAMVCYQGESVWEARRHMFLKICPKPFVSVAKDGEVVAEVREVVGGIWMDFNGESDAKEEDIGAALLVYLMAAFRAMVANSRSS